MNNTIKFGIRGVVLLIAMLTLTACGSSSGGGGGSSQTTPIEPTSVIASKLSESGIRVTWTDNSDNEDGFRVERSLPDQASGFTEITATGPDVVLIDDNGLNAETTYYYRVSAFNAAGNSNSNGASATTDPASTLPPAVPTNLQGSALSSLTIQLTWTDNATNEANYYVRRADFSGSCGTYSEIVELPRDTEAYIDSGLSASSSYCYQVEARNSVDSRYSNVISDVVTLSTFTLSVTKSGTGNGLVVAPGINCGSDCSQSFDDGDSVTLTATADSNSGFTINGWSGCDRAVDTACTVFMNTNRTVDAKFEDTFN